MDLESVQEKVKDKVGLGNFSPIFFFFFAKSLKMSFLVEKLEKNAFKIKFGFRKSLVQEKVQDKVELGNFSPFFFFFFFLQKALKCHVWLRNCEKMPLR